ncbi:MAG: DUF6122 family protein [Oceanihabitans sp.]
MLQSISHYSIHFIVPLFIALLFFKSKWKQAYIIMAAAILIDLDHLLATPIFDANRCSINFHPLHTYYAMLFYALILLPKKTRIIAIGLWIHMLADAVDCSFM